MGRQSSDVWRIYPRPEPEARLSGRGRGFRSEWAVAIVAEAGRPAKAGPYRVQSPG